MKELSIIIPCYNESENLSLLVDEIEKTINDNTELILVDNGSTDNTPELLPELVKKMNNPSIRYVRIEINQGYGNGILEGLKAATGKFISWTHADLQTDINDIYRGFATIKHNTEEKRIFLKGKRKKRPLMDQLLTFGMTVFSTLTLNMGLSDINAQPKLFHHSFLDQLIDPPKDFSLDLYVYFVAKKNKYEIVEIPVEFKKRLFGEAKGGGGSSLKTRIKLIKRTLKYILELKKRIGNQNG
jgi:glycosyltransferase involved in cell wall biosynthesis